MDKKQEQEQRYAVARAVANTITEAGLGIQDGTMSAHEAWEMLQDIGEPVLYVGDVCPITGLKVYAVKHAYAAADARRDPDLDPYYSVEWHDAQGTSRRLYFIDRGLAVQELLRRSETASGVHLTTRH